MKVEYTLTVSEAVCMKWLNYRHMVRATPMSLWIVLAVMLAVMIGVPPALSWYVESPLKAESLAASLIIVGGFVVLTVFSIMVGIASSALFRLPRSVEIGEQGMAM